MFVVSKKMIHQLSFQARICYDIPTCNLRSNLHYYNGFKSNCSGHCVKFPKTFYFLMHFIFTFAIYANPSKPFRTRKKRQTKEKKINSNDEFTSSEKETETQ